MGRHTGLLFLLLLFLRLPALAAGSLTTISRTDAADSRGPFPGAPLLLSAPLADFPFASRDGPGSPSMRQSLQWNAAAVQAANQTIGWLWEGGQPSMLRSLGTWGSLGLFNYISVYLPPGQAWLHEEWHRAVLSRRGISSYNGVYHWDLGASTISVDHVADADLADFKRKHPAEFTRLAAAGIEGEIESIRLMRRNNFFLGRKSEYDQISWWSSALNSSAYLYFCSVDNLDPDLEKAERRETAESGRDFTGLDFRAWVHDLRHPGEPYAEGPRGRTHPSGSGFDRYLKYGDLTHGERVYLRWQSGLSLLNLVSPQFFGRDWLPGVNPWDGRGYLWNFGLAHRLAPFGFNVGGDFLLRRGKWAWAFEAQGFVNGKTALPGIGGELFRYPVTVGRKNVFLTCGASAWLQPEDLAFRTVTAQPGAALHAGAAVPLLAALELFAEADAKTPGWVPGNVYLDAAAQARAGLQIRL